MALPATHGMVSVPCNVPVPALRDAVTNVFVLHRLPYMSTTHRIGCCANGTPAVAVGEGCVTIITSAGVPGLTVMLLEVAGVRLTERLGLTLVVAVNWMVMVLAAVW